jgi:Zn-dependent peptidase ImmA (M78 family)/transcriptional regulator with XRE-family HTH domain
MFTPSRLTLARMRRRLSKKELAEAMDLTPHSILRYEMGDSAPSDEIVERLAKLLGFPAGFFHGPEPDTLPQDAASFRSMSAMSARERDAALAAGSIAYIVSDWVEQHFDLPQPDLLDVGGDMPEVAAVSVREKWGLGEQPIKNMAHLLEAKGVRLFSMAENALTVDAFSVWRGGTPYVFLNTMKSAEHSRHDAAHELGHLTMHKHGGPTGRDAEDQANAFAAAFLMPSADVIATLPRVHTLNQVIEAKKRWGVSVMSLIHRLNRLSIISPWQYRMFCRDATEKGYRRAEPLGLAREHSVVWQKVLTVLWKERTTKADIARSLYLPEEELENLLFGLAGGPPGEPEAAVRPPLRLIS